MKCDSCEVNQCVNQSDEPACCKWYMLNVVIGNKSTDDCTEYKPVKQTD